MIAMHKYPRWNSPCFKSRWKIPPSAIYTTIYINGISGHIHQTASPAGPYRNVSVEALDDYTPVHIETLAAEAKQYMEKVLTSLQN